MEKSSKNSRNLYIWKEKKKEYAQGAEDLRLRPGKQNAQFALKKMRKYTDYAGYKLKICNIYFYVMRFWRYDMVTIYMNGKRIAKDEIRKTEIHSEAVKRILSKKLTKKG